MTARVKAIRAAAMLALAALCLGAGPATAADMRYLGRVTSADSPVSEIVDEAGARVFAAVSVPYAARRDCRTDVPDTNTMSTSERLDGDVWLNLDTGEIRIDWTAEGGVARVSRECRPTVHVSTTLSDTSFWCFEAGEVDEHAQYAESQQVETRLAGRLERVLYFRSPSVGVPCYRIAARVTLTFRASYTTYAGGTGPVGPGCLRRHWDVTFAPTLRSPGLNPDYEWVTVGPASPEQPCAA